MVTLKRILLVLTTLGFPVFCMASDEQLERDQQLEFLSFLAFLGSVTEMESAGIDVDHLLANPLRKPELPEVEGENDE